MKQAAKYTALYCRLSKDDLKEGDSASIETQRIMLTQFAREQGLLPVRIYTDDGYSGLNFERPGFQKMIDDIIIGEIQTVITKDLSRLGRDHLTVGHYTEIYFPTHKVRYIAVNDGVDTANTQSTDFAALKNVINEFYSRDNSRKIKAAFKARAKEGKYRSKSPPYGYLKDPDDHNHLIPDPETAPYVAKMFEQCAQGWGNYRIRESLRKNKVPIPSWYQHVRGIEDKSRMFPDEASRYIWRPDTLRLIIRNRVYCGDCVLCKSETIFKTKRHPKVHENDWIVVKDTHEPLVSRDLWQHANELISVKRQEYRNSLSGYRSLFAGLLKCSDCGKALSRRKYGKNSRHQIFVCGTYATYGVYKCSAHMVFEEDLKAAVLADIRSKSEIALRCREELIETIVQKSRKTVSCRQEAMETQSLQLAKRLAVINKLVDSLYEDVVLSRISQDNFDRMIGKYQKEQKALQLQLSSVEQVEKELADSRSDAEKCAELLARHADITELTSELLNILIQKIVVNNAHDENGVMEQNIDIYYRHGGLLDSIEFDSSRFYRSGAVSQPSRQRVRSWNSKNRPAGLEGGEQANESENMEATLKFKADGGHYSDYE